MNISHWIVIACLTPQFLSTAPVETPPPEIAGIWVGSIVAESGGEGKFSLSITQTEGALKGSWKFELPTGGKKGSVTGSVRGGGGLTLDLSPKAAYGECMYLVYGTVNEDTITGSLSGTDCSPPKKGKINLSKQ